MIDPKVSEYEEALDRALAGAMDPPEPDGRLTVAMSRTPVDWPRVIFWCTATLFCLAFWAVVIRWLTEG